MEVSPEIFNDMRKRFDDSNQEIYKRKNTNTQMLTKEMYLQAVENIKAYKTNNIVNSPALFRQYRGFDVLSLDGIDKLIVRNTENNPRYYVHMEEMFQIVYDTHVAHGHCGRNRLEKEINSKYKNITREMMRNFLFICYICEQKRPVRQITEKVKPNCSHFESRFPRGQVNVMDMVANQDGPYKYILVYEDHLTKFVQLRPLKTCSIKDIVGSLLKIFSIFGAPAIIHSDNGREFASEIIRELCNQWHPMKIVHGKPEVSTLNQDILELIDMWMEKNRINKWSKCLHYVQLMKNKCHHKEINSTPYEVMFGSKCKIGLDYEDLGVSTLDEVRTEDDLRALVKKETVLKIKQETGDNNCNEGSVDYFENYLTSLKQENESDEENANCVEKIRPSKMIKLSGD